ncbi:MAG: tripartite tricarboxylate transporter substrate binding protein [Pigmentiphaga sp.]|uniref:Bug family tripartite tricarboxylate transporter substrate binding protein n=1 Tax=Pigmentiphaga sp. TaxID=1977564 RepID=UPI0029B6052F|nr:tripartite tricarboxylate transporter substrate binding protein [Pigmentiphaga sp.]MDX3906501.1 tripartite tricarboxylate transporter substrate binding protein [Pigmentiphaga sp.]
MKIVANRARRQWLKAATSIALVAGAPFSAWAADAFPSRPVRMVVSFPPGGATDTIARELAQSMKAVWNEPVIVENRPGAAGVIAAENVSRATPDGSTLFLTTDGAITGVPFLPGVSSCNPLTDLKPVSLVAGIPLILVANPSLGVKTLDEFIALAKRRPGEIDYASGGTGASHHLSMEALQRAAGIQLNHIAYKGGAPGLQDVVAGHVPVMWVAVSTVLSQIQAGKVVPLAIGSLERSRLLPNVPTMDELGFPKFEAGNWVGVMGPPGLPDALVRKIQADLATVTQSKEYKDRIGAQGNEARTSGTAEFAERIKVEYARNKELAAELAAAAKK